MSNGYIMKFLFAIKKLADASGGAERVLCTIASELAARGHDVTIMTFDQPGRSPFYPLDSRVKRVDLGIGNTTNSARSFETFTRILAARRVVLSSRPDVAIGFMHSMFVPLSFALAGTGIPVIGSEHIVPEHYRGRRLEFLLVMVSSFFMTKITILSERIRDQYPFFLRRKMVVLPNPVAAAMEIADSGADRSNSVLLNVGRLDAQKDQATLIKAFAKLSPQYPTWKLRIVGEGILRGELLALISTVGMTEKIALAGVTPNIANEFANADIFVLPSLYESFGLATAEAMSHGLPVIGFSDCSGTNELIVSGETGLLVDPGSDRIESLAKGLQNLMSHPAICRRLGEAARRSIDWRFSPTYVSGLWEKMLVSLNTTGGT